tara:strand:- start:249 stop:527 length:279 start_codon:yes stop_codon:yes gene_type:complete
MKLTSKQVKQYMTWRTDEELMHCPDAIAAACNDMYEEYKHNEFAKITAKDFMKLLFFNDPIVGMNTHSYGFNTANGRHIINTLQNKYYEYEN